MATLQEEVDDFLSQKRLAVAGVSRNGNEAANGIFRKLYDADYEGYSTNPKAEEVEGVPCYPDLKSIPEVIDGVVIATHPDITEQVVPDSVEIGVSHLWLHRSFGQGIVSDAAVEHAPESNITIIPGGCPMMFVEPVDIGHKCIRWFAGITGSLPKEV